jgi:tRNA(Arg) A34 adenosine deaminase TadA
MKTTFNGILIETADDNTPAQDMLEIAKQIQGKTQYIQDETISFYERDVYQDEGDDPKVVVRATLKTENREYCGNNRIHGVEWLNAEIVQRIWYTERDIGRALVTHAEKAAIINAMDNGVVDFTNSTMYVSLRPCSSCRKLIEILRIKTVYYAEEYHDSNLETRSEI